jgi:hypothetical protein
MHLNVLLPSAAFTGGMLSEIFVPDLRPPGRSPDAVDAAAAE